MTKLFHSRKVGVFVLQVWLCVVSAFASAGDDRATKSVQTTGLMWNRTGLPAVFPLQVKAPPGQDYFLTLIDVETDEDALAAYIIGGDFFKVLVPPGEFRLRFAAGMDWKGEEFLFGPGKQTHIFELNETLTFEIRNLTIKAGHVVNLLKIEFGQVAQSSVKEQLICQSLRRTYPSRRLPFWADQLVPDTQSTHWIRSRDGYHNYLGDRARDKNKYLTPDKYDVFDPKYSLTSRYCG
ncbi:hypothetical protein [Roseovarius sp. EL26]|uniref:hypothetical protein n=1 Tax=Roseovarius sp. EL26 TaxID=2126672 RepID=UPI0013C4FAAF|nr:hypothetical protein [Roseovarius sp. EL26]